jgi:hypothetical protein
LSAILVNEKEESRFWRFSGWAAKIKASLTAIFSCHSRHLCDFSSMEV